MATIVYLHAHPDDEASQTAGTMARASAEGHRVVVVFATNGDHGEIAADAIQEAASDSTGGGAPSAGGMPAEMAAKIAAAIPQDFAVATRAVLIGMAVALAICLLVSVLHPGGVVTHEKPEQQPLAATPETV